MIEQELDTAITLVRQSHISLRDGYLELKKSDYIQIMNKLKKAYFIMKTNYPKFFKDTGDNTDTFSLAVRIKIDNTFEYLFPYYKENSRKRHIVTARHAYIYFLRKYTAMSLMDIAEIFNQDHSSVIHALKKMDALLETKDKLTVSIVDTIETALKSEH
jgi:hypothetical protein